MTPPGHPESPERAEVMDVVAPDGARAAARSWRRARPRASSWRACTSTEHLHRMAETAGQADGARPRHLHLARTYEVALLAAGAAVDAVERVMGGSHTRALALSRPPGHHAERDRAMGFCFFNNVAVAAAHARALGAHRVAIVDYDVHHGNGTQHIFESRSDGAVRVHAPVPVLPRHRRGR